MNEHVRLKHSQSEVNPSGYIYIYIYLLDTNETGVVKCMRRLRLAHLMCPKHSKKVSIRFPISCGVGPLVGPKTHFHWSVHWDLYTKPARGCLATWDRIWMRWLRDILQHSQPADKTLESAGVSNRIDCGFGVSNMWEKQSSLVSPTFHCILGNADTWDRPKKQGSVNAPFSISCVPGFLMTT